MGTDILGGDRLTQNTMDTEKEEEQDNLQTTSKNFQKPSRLLPETLKTPQRICLGTSQYLNMLAPGGWVGGGPHCIIIPLCGPTCKLRTCKNSSLLEFQVGPKCRTNSPIQYHGERPLIKITIIMSPGTI